MSRCVHIFGGLGTKAIHYKYAIEVYHANNFNPFFYESRYANSLTLRHVNQHVTAACKNDPNGTIIHVNSAGYYSGVMFHKQATNNKLFVCESGPVESDAERLIYVHEQLYNFKCPVIIRNNIQTILKCIGVPTKKNDPELMQQFQQNANQISNFVCLTSKNDHIIDNAFIDTVVRNIRDHGGNAERHLFTKGSHHNLSKSETLKYQELLDAAIKKIEL